MVVGICDDHAEERERIYKVCEVVLEQMGCPAEIALFEGASFVLQTSKKPDILILDIEMPGMTGIELKEALQSEEGATYIIFVTVSLPQYGSRRDDDRSVWRTCAAIYAKGKS